MVLFAGKKNYEKRLKCPVENCKSAVTTFKKLDDHLKVEHDIDVKTQQFTFRNLYGQSK